MDYLNCVHLCCITNDCRSDFVDLFDQLLDNFSVFLSSTSISCNHCKLLCELDSDFVFDAFDNLDSFLLERKFTKLTFGYDHFYVGVNLRFLSSLCSTSDRPARIRRNVAKVIYLTPKLQIQSVGHIR